MNKRQVLIDNVKNLIGWKTSRKIVVFSVDDYGNVRLDSAKARSKMDKAGLKVYSRFDAYDALETKEDLEMLYEVLHSVKDGRERSAIFTPFALPCNIDFERMKEENFQSYHYEKLPITYSKLRGYEGTWEIWEEGIKAGLMVPQFHGREHLNLKVLNEKLDKRDHEVLCALQNRSYTSISDSGYQSISYTAAFDFWDFSENEKFSYILTDGLNAFESVFGYRATHFTPPVYRIHSVNFPGLVENGIRYIDVGFIQKQHQGNGKYNTKLNITGQRKNGLLLVVRNVVFEPCDNSGIDWVSYTLRQIETAFYWNRPAIISSHRVNFSGHIDPANRKMGINTLRELLKKIVSKWPDVEFMSANELGDLISHNS